MKYCLLCFILFLTGCASVIDTPPLQYDEIHVVENVSKEQICNKSRDWIALNFSDSNEVFKIVDISNGTIIGRGTSFVADPFYYGKIPVKFVFDIRCKDNAIKIVMNDFIMMYPSDRIGNTYFPPHEFRLHNSTYVMHQDNFKRDFDFIPRLLEYLTTETNTSW